MSPFGPADLGAHPSPTCARAQSVRDGSHRRCSGSWRPFVIFAPTPCTCSCHKQKPVADVNRDVQETTDRRLRDLAEWYSGNLGHQQAYRDLFLNDAAFVPGPGQPVVISDETCTPSTGQCAEPEIQPEAAKLMGWIDEGPQFVRGEGLQGPDEMVDVADPASYEIPEVPHGLNHSTRRLPAGRESTFLISGEGVVDGIFEIPDEMRNEVLISGRAFGKNAAADRWREARLEELASRNEGLIVTIVSRAVYELAERSLQEREVQVARAIQADKGLAVIRGEVEWIPPIDDTGTRVADFGTLRKPDVYLATKKIPTGCIYDFPHREAFEAWEARNDD